jgi:hypothetical protein
MKIWLVMDTSRILGVYLISLGRKNILGAVLSHPRILGVMLGVVQEQNFLGVYRTHQIPNFKEFWNKMDVIPKLGGMC